MSGSGDEDEIEMTEEDFAKYLAHYAHEIEADDAHDASNSKELTPEELQRQLDALLAEYRGGRKTRRHNKRTCKKKRSCKKKRTCKKKIVNKKKRATCRRRY